MMRFTKFSVAASSFALLVGTIAAPVFAQPKPTMPDLKTPGIVKPRMESLMIQGKVQYVSKDQDFAIVKTPRKTFLVKVDRNQTVFQTPDGERITGARLTPGETAIVEGQHDLLKLSDADKSSTTLPKDIQEQLKQGGNPSVSVLQAQLIARAGK